MLDFWPLTSWIGVTHKGLSTSVPPYIDELLEHQVTTRSQRSTDALRLSVPWTRNEIAKRAFCVAAPNVWNFRPSLPSFFYITLLKAIVSYCRTLIPYLDYGITFLHTSYSYLERKYFRSENYSINVMLH